MATILGLALVAAGFGWYQSGLAHKELLISLSRQLAAKASNELGQGDLQSALLFSTAVYNATDTPEARRSLHRTFAAQPQLGTFLSGHQNEVWAAAFSPDGWTLATASQDKIVILSDVARRIPMNNYPLEGHQDVVARLAFSSDGRTLASASWERTVILWDLGLLYKEHEDFASIVREACTIANRNLTHGEWAQFVGAEVPYQAPCPELPVPKD